MIEPIKTTIKQGKSKADISIEPNSMNIKFENPTPRFQSKVVEFVDTFVWSGQEQNQENLDGFKIDNFVKVKNDK